MTVPTLLGNRQFKAAALVLGAVAAGYLVVNLFVIGGDELVYALNQNSLPPLALLTTIFAFTLWRFVREGRNRILWGGVLAGFALWTVGETLWAVFGVLWDEVPYPSIADLFYVLGYVPLGVGLSTRLREMPLKPTAAQRAAAWAVSIGVVGLTAFFVLAPIVQQFEPEQVVVNALNVIYPFADLCLLLIILHLLFAYQGGDYGFGWLLLTAGFFVLAGADLAFAYATTAGVYYPDQRVNLISTLGVDVPYVFSYMILILGVFALRLLLGAQRPVGEGAAPQPVSNVHILIYLQSNDAIIEVSGNFARLFGADRAKGRTLVQALSIADQDQQIIRRQLQTQRAIADHPLRVVLRSGESQEAWLSGIALFSPDGQYEGSNLLLRTLEPAGGAEEDLGTYSQSIIRHIREKSGSREDDQVRALLLDYYGAHFRALFNLMLVTGGPMLSQAFLEAMQAAARRHGWHIRIEPQALANHADVPLDILRANLPPALDAARRFAVQATDATTVDGHLRDMRSKFHDSVEASVAYHTRIG